MLSSSLFAVDTDDKKSISSMFEEGQETIDIELSQLNEINDILLNKSMSFDVLKENHSALVGEANLSPAISDGIFDNHPDSPLGVPAFWWGFCLGLIGMLVVYISMDEGSDRKDQVQNALYGCLISGLIALVLNLTVFSFIF